MALLNTTFRYQPPSDSRWWGYESTPCTTTLANIGPLTTPFTPPASCPSLLYSQVLGLTDNNGSTLSQCPDRQAYRSCLPHAGALGAYSDTWTIQSYGGEVCSAFLTYYSPAVSCPTGWQTVGSFTYSPSAPYYNSITDILSLSIGHVLHNHWPAIPGTHRLCCPSSWSLTKNNASSYCQSSALLTSLTTTHCNAHCTESANRGIYGLCDTSTKSFTYTYNASANSTSPMSLTYRIEPIYMVANPAQSSSSAYYDSSDGDSLPTGAKMAIGASIAVTGFLFMIALIIMRGRYLRRKRAQTVSAAAADAQVDDVPPPRFVSNEYPLDLRRDVELEEVGDLPPAYDSQEVWGGDGRVRR